MARNIWLISDTHFQHENILKFSPGPFGSVEERDETLIENWNKVVKTGDKVYHLGDVFFGSKETFKPLWNRLNGSKRLIVGNHDDIKFMSTGGFFQKIALWRVWPDKPILLTHVPVHQDCIEERLMDSEGVNVHGHTHTYGSPDGPYKTVCAEMVNYTPVNIDEII